MNELVCKEIIAQGEESYQHLEKLSFTLRTLKNDHALRIFDYSSNAMLHENEKSITEVRELLDMSIHGLECFGTSIRDEKDFLDTFQNADFVLNAVDICIRRLQSISLNEDMSRAITVIENISNDLYQLVRELKGKAELLDF